MNQHSVSEFHALTRQAACNASIVVGEACITPRLAGCIKWGPNEHGVLAMLLGALIDPMGRILTKKGVQVTRFRRTHGREMNVK